jgi:hypothetical protein
MIEKPLHPTHRNEQGVQMQGPAAAATWASPSGGQVLIAGQKSGADILRLLNAAAVAQGPRRPIHRATMLETAHGTPLGVCGGIDGMGPTITRGMLVARFPTPRLTAILESGCTLGAANNSR